MTSFRELFFTVFELSGFIEIMFSKFFQQWQEKMFSLKWKLLVTHALKELPNKGSNIARLEIKLSELAMLKEKRSTFIIPPIKSFISHLIKLKIEKDLCRRGKRIPIDLLSL